MPAPAPPPPENWVNRTLYHNDNLPVLRGINSETIDLIATDPPFNKGKDFHATPDSLAAGASFQDRWRWEEVHKDWVESIQDDHSEVWQVIDTAKASWGDDMGAFLCFMAVRVLEMHRILKPTGSLYLHCDPTASHYLKLMLDAIFGREGFRNEIVWCYSTGGASRVRFARKHDILLFYGKGKEVTFNTLRIPYTSAMSRDPKHRHKFHPDGKIMLDWWADIMPINPLAAERVGYPTQKPLALYERVIEASSNRGDVVLDPFCGCATTVVAAERRQRRWIGIDLWKDAHQTVLQRIQNEVLDVPDVPSSRLLTLGDVSYTQNPPNRTDNQATAAPAFQVPISWRSPVTQMTHAEMTRRLKTAQAAPEPDQRKVVCAGCGRSLEPDFMHLDHVTPKKDGGDNYITNRVLLCGPCNSKKGSKRTISGMRDDNRAWIIDRAAAEDALASARAAGQRALQETIAEERGRLPLT